MVNGNYIDNAGEGIYSEPEGGSVDIFVTDTLTCRNNNINLESGSLIPMGTIIADNCTITVEGTELDLSAGEVGYLEYNLDTTGDNNDALGNSDYGVALDIYTDVGTTGDLEVTFSTEKPELGGYYYSNFGKYIDVTLNLNDGAVLDYAIIKIYYTDEELTAAGLTEDTLRIEYYNDTSSTWEIFDAPRGGVNIEENYVWANVTHFSTYGVFGSAPASSAATGGDS